MKIVGSQLSRWSDRKTERQVDGMDRGDGEIERRAIEKGGTEQDR